MTGSMISFKANGRTAQGYLAAPATGAGPGVIVIHEFWGLADHIRGVADRFAAEGFVALAPDLYHGERSTSPDDAKKLMMALDIATADVDLAGAVECLRSNDRVLPKKIGLVGFCMGGQLALYAAEHHPDTIGAAVDFYGIHPNAPVNPAAIEVPVLGHFATMDKSVPLDRARELFASMRAAGVDAEMHVYDAAHAFFNDSRPSVYNADAATLAWERTIAFFRDRLSSPGS